MVSNANLEDGAGRTQVQDEDIDLNHRVANRKKHLTKDQRDKQLKCNLECIKCNDFYNM